MGEVRPPVVLGVSLKLYLDVPETLAWARQVATIARGTAAIRDGRVALFVMPSLPAVGAVTEILADTGVQVGAQDLHWESRGAFTGAVSGEDLFWMGCRFVEVGHAERRLVFGESEEVTQRKLGAAVRAGLVPVLCIGEDERLPPEASREVCVAQLHRALAGLAEGERMELLVAYEPVWAIGKAEAADAAHVRTVARGIRAALADDGRVSSFSIIYGGSAKRGTLTELGSDIDGLFLGRFAHRPDELARIVDEADALRDPLRS